MQYVAYAPRSSSQVRKRLQQKGVDEQSINCALETMRRYGYIDDAAYIREFVRSYSAKLGEQAIRQKLLQNGVAGSLIDEVLELPEQTQLEAARACLRKKLPAWPGAGAGKGEAAPVWRPCPPRFFCGNHTPRHGRGANSPGTGMKAANCEEIMK